MYKLTNKTTGEEKMVLPHTFGDGFILFAEKPEEMTTEAWMELHADNMIRIENPNDDGNFVSDEYDVELIEDVTPESDEDMIDEEGIAG